MQKTTDKTTLKITFLPQEDFQQSISAPQVKMHFNDNNISQSADGTLFHNLLSP